MDKRRKVKVKRHDPAHSDKDLSNRIQVAFGIFGDIFVNFINLY